MNRLLLLIPFLLLFVMCTNGADDLSDLSSMVFNALKSQNQTSFVKCEPTVPDMEKAIEMNLEDSTRTVAARHEAAVNKTAVLQLSLDRSFTNVIAGAKEKNIDWKTAQLKDFKYIIHERAEDYKDADVSLVIANGKTQSKLGFKAYLFGNRWYLIEGLSWEN